MCVNSVSCTDKGQSVECVCKAGFTGYNCAVNINDCLSHPCKNGGTCRDKVNGFDCICKDGFLGKTCQGQLNCYLNSYVVILLQFLSSLLYIECFETEHVL